SRKTSRTPAFDQARLDLPRLQRFDAMQEKLAEGFAELRMCERELYGCFQVTELAAAVVAGPVQATRPGGLVFQQRRDGVGQLYLAARAALGLAQQFEDARRQHIATNHAEV